MRSIHYLFILVAVCVIVYFNGITGELVSDDVSNIVTNTEVTKPYPETISLLNSATYYLFKANPVPYHLVGIALHCVASVLLFLLLARSFSSEASFFATLLFAVHPIHTEAVTWVSGRSQVMLGIYFLALALLIERKGIKNYLICLLIVIWASIHYYAWMFLIVLTLFARDLIFRKGKESYRLFVPLLLVPCVFAFLDRAIISQRLASISPIIVAGGIDRLVGLPQRFAVALCQYVPLYLFPWRLTPYHEPILVKPIMLRVEMAVAFYVLAVVFFWVRRRRMLFWALLIFLIMLAFSYLPQEIGFFVAERYMYIPSISFSILLAWSWDKLRKRYNGDKK